MEKECCYCHKNKERSEEEMGALIRRLHRIEGQVRGLSGMVERSAYCPDILNQVAATRAALDAFSRELLASHIRTCVAEDVRQGREDTVEELVSLLQGMLK